MEKFSIPDFKTFMPIPLSCPTTKPLSQFLVFSNPSPQSPPNSSNPIAVHKFKAAIELFDFAHFPTLVQFWALNSQAFLQTSDLPFGLSVLKKGLCVFRKHCLNLRYSVDDADVCSPQVRVFRRRLPEFCPDVGCYSVGEFELRDFAVGNGIRGCLLLPVFEPDWRCCIGVIEIFTEMDGSYCFGDVVQKVSDSLKEVGLVSSDVFWPFDMKRLAYNQNGNDPPEHELVLDEIQKVLDILCKTYKLPFAQTWVENDQMMSVIKHSTKRASPFQKDCSWFHLTRRQGGIVGKAFSSRTSCICTDITRLSISEYALVLSARKVALSAAFAICLQTGTAIYVIELFLPADQNVHEKLSSFLSSMLVTMKQELRTFKLGSGRDIGTDLSVEVLKISKDDPLDSFVVSQTMFAECSQDGGVVESDDVTTHNRNELHRQQTINAAMRTLSLGDAVSPEVLEKRHGKRLTSFPDSPTAKKSTSKNPRSVPNIDINSCKTMKRSKVECPLIPNKPQQNEESIMTVKVEYESDIIKFKLPVSSGMKQLKDEVTKRIKLSAGTYEIKYRCEDNISIELDSDAKLQEHMSGIRSSGMSTIKLFITTIVTKNEVKITVKASFKDDIIKFQLSPSARLSELKNEMIRRLKLEEGSFEIKYNDQNKLWTVVDSDAALQDCIRSFRKTTIRLSIEPMRTDNDDCKGFLRRRYHKV